MVHFLVGNRDKTWWKKASKDLGLIKLDMRKDISMEWKIDIIIKIHTYLGVSTMPVMSCNCHLVSESAK